MTLDSAAANKSTTAAVMRTVLLAMAPGLAAMLWFFGFGALSNIALSLFFSVLFEVLALRWRQLPLHPQLFDGSVLITALLLALAVPPGASIWLLALGSGIAVLLAKHAFGGYGQNVFNPAMAGYALLLILFPAAFTHWPMPGQFDGLSGATTLNVFRQNNGQLVTAWWQSHPRYFGHIGGYGWEWINAAFLAGGLWLLYRKIFTWHIPLTLLAMLGVCAIIFYDNGSSTSDGSPLFHWFSGATMLGAFFVATEPITAPRQIISRLIYGAAIGALIFVIRCTGRYADGVAFAVLLGNAIVPLLDRIAISLPSKPLAPEQRDEQ